MYLPEIEAVTHFAPHENCSHSLQLTLRESGGVGHVRRSCLLLTQQYGMVGADCRLDAKLLASIT